MKSQFNLLSVKWMMRWQPIANIGDRLTAQRRLVDATNTTYKLSNARFRAGIDSYLTVLDAQRSAYSAETRFTAVTAGKPEQPSWALQNIGWRFKEPIPVIQ